MRFFFCLITKFLQNLDDFVLVFFRYVEINEGVVDSGNQFIGSVDRQSIPGTVFELDIRIFSVGALQRFEIRLVVVKGGYGIVCTHEIVELNLIIILLGDQCLIDDICRVLVADIEDLITFGFHLIEEVIACDRFLTTAGCEQEAPINNAAQTPIFKNRFILAPPLFFLSILSPSG